MQSVFWCHFKYVKDFLKKQKLTFDYFIFKFPNPDLSDNDHLYYCLFVCFFL